MRRPTSTYSIAALDAERGEMGVAVQSHWFSVGSLVPWCEAGVGVVATQSMVEPAYGPRILSLLRFGMSAEEALEALVRMDSLRDYRQIGVVDVRGGAAAYTGSRCIPEAGHLIGEGFTVQANIMRSAEVWPAMAEAFRRARGELAERLLEALLAGERAGGDLRGMQSAAILIVRARPTGRPWLDKLVDLKVEDSSNPLRELQRLLRLHKAYQHANRGDELASQGRFDEAMKEYDAASSLAPEVEEHEFWKAVTMLNHGRVREAAPILRRVFEENRAMITLLRRLPGTGLLKLSAQEVEKILSCLKIG